MTISTELTNDDWLSQILTKTRLGSVQVGLLLLVVNLLTTIPLALLYGSFFRTSSNPGLVSDPTAWLNDWVATPAVFAYFHWIQGQGSRIFQYLIGEDVFADSKPILLLLDESRQRMQNPWIKRLAMVTGIGFALWFLVTFTVNVESLVPDWVTINPAIPIIRAPMMAIAIYALTLFVLDAAIIISTLNRVFKSHHPQLRPLHPDRAGGLAAIGKFSANLGYLVGILGFAISIRFVQTDAYLLNNSHAVLTVAAIGLYLLIAPLLFFLPLLAARKSMLKSRNDLLGEISEESVSVFAQIHTKRSHSAEEIEPLLKRYRQLEEMHQTVQQFPIWPFNAESIRRFFTVVAGPLVPIAISLLSDMLIT